MDPLSVTLAVITLATAVKDMAELGQKIHESFAKISSNFKKAQCVAEDIKEMVNEIKVFYEDHKDMLDNMKDFRLALVDLLAKFRSFEASILPLLPQTGRRTRDRLARAWAAWRNNNRVEGCILDLQSEIVKVMRRHMMKSAMRAEVKLETIHQDTSRGLTGITQGLEVLQVVQRNVSAIAAVTVPHRLYEPSGTSSDEFTHNIIMFAQSSPSSLLPMLRTPNVITEEVATTVYIKVHINSIAMLVEKMSMLPQAVSASTRITPFVSAPMLEEASMGITHLRHHVVKQVAAISNLLNISSIHIISIREGASALTELSTGLQILGMIPESILVGTSAVTLTRLLVSASGEHPDCAAVLALYLLNQSKGYYAIGNNIQSLQAIKEAYAITQNLQNQYSGKVHFQELYSSVLLQYARLVNNQESIKMSAEAIQVLEHILNICGSTQLTLHEKTEIVVQPSSSILDCLSFSAPSITALVSYAYALQSLAAYIFSDGHHESALGLANLAIAMHRKMVSIYGQEHQVSLVTALLSLVCSEFAILIPTEELVDMADECIQLLQELAEKNPPYYARKLVSTLWVKARALQKLGQGTEAIATWEEVASIAGQIVQDSKLYSQALGNLSQQFRHLRRHDDAVRTGTLAITTYHEAAETRAGRYFDLSRDLQELCRYKESVEAAQTSVMLYRQLAMSNSTGRWMDSLAICLSDLAHCLAASGDYSAALIAWIESVNILENLVHIHAGQSSDAIDRYCVALDIHNHISLILKDDKECLKVSSTTTQCFRQLLKIYPQNKNIAQSLLKAEFFNAYNMLRVGHLQDAEQYISNRLDEWRSKPEAILSESTNATWYAEMVRLKADVLDAQGCTKQALLVIQDICVEVSVSTSQPALPVVMDLLHHEVRLRVSLGDGGGALQVAEVTLQRARDNKSEPIIDGLVWSLHGVAFTASLLHDYHRALEAAQEGCDILARPEGLEFDWNSEYYSFIRPSLFAILSSAEANLGKCSTALEYANCAVGLSLEIGDNKLHISITDAARSYMETRGNLANILLATGDTAQALQICEERSVYFSKRVGTQMGEYRELAPILRMLGILFCSEGRHEEGHTAAKELTRIMKMLGSTFPSLQEQVKIRLRHQAQVPILKVLELMSQQLDCGHQAEVALLATI